MNAKRAAQEELVLLPLGGVGEIGMNCYCYGQGTMRRRDWIIVDLGVKFGSEREPGIDVVLPDMSFMTAQKGDLHGIVVTHGHEDHIGAIAWLWPRLKCEVHCTAFAAELLKLKLKEHGIEEDVPLIVQEVGKPFKLGPFELQLLPVTHSIPQSCALEISTVSGRVLHSGDWKIDRTPVLGEPFNEKPFIELGKKGVDVLVCDSTNVLREGFSPSETDVAATLDDIVSEAQGRVIVTTFASQVERIQSAVNAARKNSREVVIAGRAMRNTIEAARNCGILKGTGSFLDQDEFGYLPPDKVLLLCTGSQGEPRAAISRIAEDTHPSIALSDGDLVIFSARTIPGNEKAVGAVVNNLAKLGVDILTSDDALVHTSGHPRQGELELMYGWVKPRAVIPVHGEPRHLHFHSKFAQAQGIASAPLIEDGDIVRLAPGSVEIIDEAHAGSLHVDGNLIVPTDEGPAKQRRKLSFNGVVIIGVAINVKHDLASAIQIQTEGVPLDIVPHLFEAAEKAFASTPKPRRKDEDVVAETIRNAVRRAADSVWGKKPVCKVIVQRIG
jgi:ribonuclease J